LFASEIRKKRIYPFQNHSDWRWLLDEVFVKINGQTHYLWRAVDHESEMLECFVSKRRDRRTAIVFLKKIMKRYGKRNEIVTDRLRSYRAAMKTIGNAEVQEVSRWLNNRCENSHLPFRRREQAMLQFKRLRSLPKFVSIHSSFHNHFNHERRLNNRETFKLQRNAALAEWQ
jgi:putative transposase|tara:strand:+ start:2736 stop:3251 length:516 start_codon:yes stop_codon:yes gene_type:complete